MPIAIMGLAYFPIWEGESGALFLWDFTCCAGLPLPIRLHPSESGVVYNGFRSDSRQDPKEMKKAIPSL